MPPSPERLRRFSAGERAIHFALALLMGLCIVTAALLYVDPLSALVGRRDLVASVHFACGLLLPVPLLIGAWRSRSFRRDAGRLNRFHSRDWQWLRSRDRRSGAIPVDKFNAGQKLNSAFVLGAVLVMFGTGLMLHYFALFADDIRTGATFVHDMFAAAVVIISGGHVWMAYRDPEARKGLRTGTVDATWARYEHSLWAEEETAGRPERS